MRKRCALGENSCGSSYGLCKIPVLLVYVKVTPCAKSVCVEALSGAKRVICDYRPHRITHEADLTAEALSFLGPKEVGIDPVRFNGELGNGVGVKRG